MSIYQNMVSVMAVVMIAVMWTDRQAYARHERRGYCYSSNDCGFDACCLVGFERYSFPRCAPRGNIGDWCRAQGSPRSMTLGYPNGDMIEVQEAYHGMCPCLTGLVCSEKTQKCGLPESFTEDNSVKRET